MPILKSAIKKLKQSKKKRDHNRTIRAGIKVLLDSFKKKPTPGAFSKLVSALDKAAKKNLIHRNKAARLKSRLSKLLKSSAKSSEKKILK